MRYFQGWQGFFTPLETPPRAIFEAGLQIEVEWFLDAGITISPSRDRSEALSILLWLLTDKAFLIAQPIRKAGWTKCGVAVRRRLRR